jgi:ribonuclease HII
MLGFDCRFEAIVHGDALVGEISAASILAKVARDAWMTTAAAVYPDYGFERHKGYPTPLHLGQLAQHGPCRLHRQSFAPVKSRHAPD